MTLLKRVLLVAICCLVLPALAGAQGRNAQITQAAAAYGNFDSPAALRLLRTALDPAAGPADSAWGSGVQLLAQILIEDGKDSLAATWLRWAFRTSPLLRIDSVTYPPPVVAAAKAAQLRTRGGTPGDGVTTTRFVPWSLANSPDTVGFMRTPISANPVVRVLVEGVGLVTPNQNLSLAPGTYNVQATVDGYVSARVTREILPGVTTSLQFALRSNALAAADTILPPTVRARADRQLVKLTVRRFGSEVSCGTGVFVSGDGLVLTSYQAIRGADALEAEFLDATPVRAGITVAAYDRAANVAILRVPTTRADSMVPTQDVSDGQFAWSASFPGCQASAVTRARISGWTNRPNGPITLADSVAAASQGGPIFNVAGGLLALSNTPRIAVPAVQVVDLLAQARRNVAANQATTLAEVGRRENHLFGSLVIRSGTPGAVIRVTPLDPWQWPEVARQGNAPLTFAGPSGRYQVELTAGAARQQVNATIVAGAATPVAIDALPAQVASAEPPIVATKKGKSKLPFVLLGVGGAGAAAFFVLAKKPAEPGGTGNNNGTTDFGSITIVIPN